MYSKIVMTDFKCNFIAYSQLIKLCIYRIKGSEKGVNAPHPKELRADIITCNIHNIVSITIDDKRA